MVVSWFSSLYGLLGGKDWVWWENSGWSISGGVVRRPERGRGTSDPNGQGKLYLASVQDLASRRLVGFAIGEHQDAELGAASLLMAAAIRGGNIAGVVFFHSDKGGEYTGDLFEQVCTKLDVTQSIGRVGSALDDAAAESFNSTLEWELLLTPPARDQGAGAPRGRRVHRPLQLAAPSQLL